MSDDVRLVIHFMDGSKIDARFPRQTTDPIKVAQNIRKAMDLDKLTIEMEGQLMLIPLANVKYLQVSPAPDNLPEGVIKGASLIS